MTLLDEMKRAAEVERARAVSRYPLRFSNLMAALVQIHRGQCLPLPCGAGANYLSSNSAGRLYTCHRTIDQVAFDMGDYESGPSLARLSAFMHARHVDTQDPCRGCWARYLCGGGCHAEVQLRGRDGCDFIRGWLEYCLHFYAWTLTNAHFLFEKECS